jgi:TPR repeat protein
MAEGEDLPAKAIGTNAITTSARLGSLVARGMTAISDSVKQHDSLSNESDAEELFRNGMRYFYGKEGTSIDQDKAREYFGEAAELDHTEAQLELARLLFELGEHDEAQDWLDVLVWHGYGPAIHCLVFDHDGLYGRNEDEQEKLLRQASEWYESRALAGDAKRQLEFSEILYRCYDEQESLRWLKASAEQDYGEACYILGNKYLRGEVSEYSTRQGIYWLSRAAELGRLSAYEDLGDLYLLGHGHAPNQLTAPSPRIAPDKVVAVAWYERAIANDMRRVAYKLGNHYLTGAHLDQDLLLAEKWLLHAAHAGSASAQRTLGAEYASGLRLRKDAVAAINWYRIAAAGSQRTIGYDLAEIYADGSIAPVDFDEAIRWLRSATATGGFMEKARDIVLNKFCDGRFSTEQEAVAKACLTEMANMARALVADDGDHLFCSHAIRLAKHYDLGIGVGQDTNEAIRWYMVSGLPGAQKRLTELGIQWEAN